ncbi:unnamed protein product [Ceratitis capitata]|uniref:(Mediterranean fruit fly) hypothetical protein n=1 Tax=Ceratitis capitata TaxID=7213 RepID=A0A811U803_CERCA|nr:unnamed protein product [Ceratitis capitata]
MAKLDDDNHINYAANKTKEKFSSELRYMRQNCMLRSDWSGGAVVLFVAGRPAGLPLLLLYDVGVDQAVIKNSSSSSKYRNTGIGSNTHNNIRVRKPGGTGNWLVSARMTASSKVSGGVELKIKLANVLKIKNKFMDKLHLQRGTAAARVFAYLTDTQLLKCAHSNTFRLFARLHCRCAVWYGRCGDCCRLAGSGEKSYDRVVVVLQLDVLYSRDLLRFDLCISLELHDDDDDDDDDDVFVMCTPRTCIQVQLV